MRPRAIYVLCGSVVAVGLATTLSLPAGAANNAVGVASQSTGAHVTAIVDKTCSQRDDDNGTAIPSTNSAPDPNGTNSQGADDFTVHKKKCITGQGAATQAVSLLTITADGTYFSGSGPADSYNVTYYKNAGGTPGSIVKACSNASYTDSTGLGTPIIVCPIKLKPGSYWVSVQANMNFTSGGWAWNTNNTVRGYASQWENPSDGYGTGCTTYTTTTTCFSAGEGGDFSFALSQK